MSLYKIEVCIFHFQLVKCLGVKQGILMFIMFLHIYYFHVYFYH
jgi:hypothetical protein